MMEQRVATLAEAAAALEANPGIGELWSPPDGASIHGVLWFVALQRALDRDYPGRHAKIVLDCGGRADLAIEALRAGLAAVALTAPEPVAAKVRDVAGQFGGLVYRLPVT